MQFALEVLVDIDENMMPADGKIKEELEDTIRNALYDLDDVTILDVEVFDA